MRGGFVSDVLHRATVRSGFRCALAGAAGLLLSVATSGQALAQSAAPDGSAEAPSSGGNIAKGIVGGAMIGAEAVMLTESAFRLHPGWLYLVGGGGGALAGGYLGYRIGHGSSNKPPAFLLAGGIALIIPTIMGVLTATEYAPPDSMREPSDEDSTDDGPVSSPVRLELPNVGLAQAFSRDELARFRVQQVTELHLSLVRGAF
jgi:hypothetical protein